MSDLRDELEQQFTSADTQSTTANNDVEEHQEETVANVDEWLDAPKSYTKEYQGTFKDLPQDWRKYLIEREKQVEKGFSDFGNRVNSYKVYDDAFNSRQDRLKQAGINSAKDYFNLLTRIDDGLATDPNATIQALSEAYGISQQPTSDLEQRLRSIQQTVEAQQQYFAQQQKQAVEKSVADFASAKDEAGNPKHAYFDEVRADMAQLIQTGVAKDLEDAYNKCIWSNEAVRNKLIAEQSKANLQNKLNEAERAKKAGFNPQSKTTAPERELSLREELERQFANI
jgi:hypothetical protein